MANSQTKRMPRVFITGASSGLGLEFARQYAAEGWRVIATSRGGRAFNSLEELVGDVVIRKLDITDDDQIKALAGEFRHEALDVLLNNAAIHGPRDEGASFGALDVAAWLKVLRVNAIAPMKVTEAFLPNVQMGGQKKIVFVSSRAGSIAERGLLPHHQRGGPYTYRSSKAALNAAAKSLAFDLAPRGISVITLHPGWVRTEMGGTEAGLNQETSVAGMRRVISQSSLADSGVFRNHDGAVIPW